jgi:hypothetical protein
MKRGRQKEAQSSAASGNKVPNSHKPSSKYGVKKNL